MHNEVQGNIEHVIEWIYDRLIVFKPEYVEDGILKKTDIPKYNLSRSAIKTIGKTNLIDLEACMENPKFQDNGINLPHDESIVGKRMYPYKLELNKYIEQFGFSFSNVNSLSIGLLYCTAKYFNEKFIQ